MASFGIDVAAAVVDDEIMVIAAAQADAPAEEWAPTWYVAVADDPERAGIYRVAGWPRPG